MIALESCWLVGSERSPDLLRTLVARPAEAGA